MQGVKRGLTDQDLWAGLDEYSDGELDGIATGLLEDAEPAMVAEPAPTGLEVIKHHFFDPKNGSSLPRGRKDKIWKAAVRKATARARVESRAITSEVHNTLFTTIKDSLIGLGLGESVFEIPRLRTPTKRARIPRADGRDRPLNPSVERFTKDWLDNWFSRTKLLNRNPTYRFLVSLSGAINTDVTLLFDIEDFESTIRRARSEADRITQEGRVRANELVTLEENLDQYMRNLQAISQIAQQIVGHEPVVEELEASRQRVAVSTRKGATIDALSHCLEVSFLLMAPLAEGHGLRDYLTAVGTGTLEPVRIGFSYILDLHVITSVDDSLYTREGFGGFVQTLIESWFKECAPKLEIDMDNRFKTVFDRAQLSFTEQQLLFTENSENWIVAINQAIDAGDAIHMPTELQDLLRELIAVVAVLLAVDMLNQPKADSGRQDRMYGLLEDALVDISDSLDIDPSLRLREGVDEDVLSALFVPYFDNDALSPYITARDLTRQRLVARDVQWRQNGEALVLDEKDRLITFLSKDMSDTELLEDAMTKLEDVHGVEDFAQFLTDMIQQLTASLGQFPAVRAVQEEAAEGIEKMTEDIQELKERAQVDLYSHPGDWALRPENSGFVQIDSMVVYAIEQAFHKLVMVLPDVAAAGVERLQTDPVAKPLFVSLVANEIADSRTNAPAGVYLAAHIVKQIKVQALDVIERLEFLQWDRAAEKFYMDLTDPYGYGTATATVHQWFGPPQLGGFAAT